MGKYVAMTGGRLDVTELELNQALSIPEKEFPLMKLAPDAVKATTYADGAAMQTS